MASMAYLLEILRTPLFRRVASISLITCAVVVSILLLNWIVTTVRFQRAVKQPNSKNLAKDGYEKRREPPLVPHFVPWFGSSYGFLTAQAEFFDGIRQKLAPAHLCTLRLGPMLSYIVWGEQNVNHIFKNTKYMSSDKFEEQIMTKAFGMPQDDQNRAEEKLPDAPGRGKLARKFSSDPAYHEYLLSTKAVNQLTSKFIEIFAQELETFLPSKSDSDGWKPSNLLNMLQLHMFNASATAILGKRILELSPNLGHDFFIMDKNFLPLAYGLPRIFNLEGNAARDRLIASCVQWLEQAHAEFDWGKDIDLPWDPLFGSGLIRSREKMYRSAGVTTRGRASQNVGILFALSSNTITATAWMMYYILADHDLYSKISAEVDSAIPGSITDVDLATLAALPFLQACYAESLRLHACVNVSREIIEPLLMPHGAILKPGNVLMAPSYLNHYDNAAWSVDGKFPSAEKFCPERWLRFDEKGVARYDGSGTTGKFLAYGGGAHMCPGRHFAKQEILAAVAMLVKGFEWKVLGCVKHDSTRVEEGFPEMKTDSVGNGVVMPDRDIRVKVKRKAI